MRALEAHSILDCADMAAHASLYRTESRWGLYHLRTDYPEKNDEDWFCHTLLRKKDGRMTSDKRAVEPYVVPIADDEKDLYDKQRIRASRLIACPTQGTRSMPLATSPDHRSRRRRRGQMHRRQGLHGLRRCLPARRAAHQRHDRQGLHGL